MYVFELKPHKHFEKKTEMSYNLRYWVFMETMGFICHCGQLSNCISSVVSYEFVPIQNIGHEVKTESRFLINLIPAYLY